MNNQYDSDRNMKPPRPGRSFQVNDIVRLNRGWTPMTVSHISEDGILTAYYGIYDFDPDGDPYPINAITGHYRRPISGWTWWDGDIIPGRNKPMPTNRQFRVKAQPELGTGVFLNTSTNGGFVLEFSQNRVEIFDPSEIEEIVQFTFKTRAMQGNNTVTNWSFNDPTKRVNVDDLLISETDGFVKVIEVDTKYNRPRNFIGRRLVLEDI